MVDTKLKTETIDGKKLDIFINTNGQFYATVGDDRSVSSSLEGLVKQIRARLRLERAAIPVSWKERQYYGRGDEERFKLVDGTLVGLHATNGDFLLRRLDGKSDRGSRYGRDLFRRVTPEERKRFAELQQAVAAAEKALEAFDKSLQIDGRALLAAAQPEEKP